MMERTLIKKIVEEEIELTKNRIWSRIERILECELRNSSQSSLTLRFKNNVSRDILTGDEIKGEGNTSIELSLVDDSTGNIVDVGPQASACVEIVLLKKAESDDDWSVGKFDENIVREEEGRKPLLAGNVRLQLQGGIGVLENVKLRHHARKIKPSIFRLGARVVDMFYEVRIKEAKTENFIVKDFRNKYYNKHEIPCHSDKVSRLVNIRKGGKIDKRLQVGKIFTVEHLLIRLLIDPQGLKSIAKMGSKKWDATVNNARACSSDKRMYCYMNFEQKIGVVFNLLGQVLGLCSKTQYASTTLLSENDKVSAQKLLASAYEHWENVRPFDDMNSLLKYINPPSYRANENANGESRMDSIRVEDFGSFGTMDMNIFYEASLKLGPFDPATMYPDFDDFDDFIKHLECVDRQTNGAANGSNGDEHIDPTGVTFVESQVVGVVSTTRTRRWKKLFCVSRLFSVKKSVSDGIKICKKRKVG